MIPGSESCIPRIFENSLSGVRLHIVGSLVDFDLVCWCSWGPTGYAFSATANRGLSLRGVRQTNEESASSDDEPVDNGDDGPDLSSGDELLNERTSLAN